LNESIEFKGNKGKIFLYLLGSLAFVLIGLFMVAEGIFVGYLALLFFGFCTIFILKMLFAKTRLIIASDGITDNAGSIPNLGFIPKENIIRVSVGSEFLLLELKNREELINHSKSIALSQKLNHAFTNGGFTITIQQLKDRDKIGDALKKYGYPIGDVEDEDIKEIEEA
jgi:hypothetical protein